MKTQLSLLLLAILALQACSDSNNDSTACTTAGTPAGAQCGTPAGSPAGAEGGSPAGAEGGSPAGAEGGSPAGTPAPVYTCETPYLQPQYNDVTYDTSNNMAPAIIGVDDRFRTISAVRVDMQKAKTAGSYDLSKDPQNCDVCAYVLSECGNEGCSRIFFSTGGTAEITSFGKTGEKLVGTIKGATFKEYDVQAKDFKENGSSVCIGDYNFDVLQPAIVGDIMPDLNVINCKTEEMVNLKDLAQETKALWLMGTAGWCSACRGHLTELYRPADPAVAGDEGGLFVSAPANVLKKAMILSEDDNYGVPDLAYCKRYAASYSEEAGADFYLDPSLKTTFSTLWAYIGDDGMFGLPWNVLINGQTQVYEYADGKDDNLSLETELNRLLNQ